MFLFSEVHVIKFPVDVRSTNVRSVQGCWDPLINCVDMIMMTIAADQSTDDKQWLINSCLRQHMDELSSGVFMKIVNNGIRR